MTTSEQFFDSISELTDRMSAEFQFDSELSDSGSDSYYRINDSGRTELTIDYASEIIFISHTNPKSDRTVNIEYRSPSKTRIFEISECVEHL